MIASILAACMLTGVFILGVSAILWHHGVRIKKPSKCFITKVRDDVGYLVCRTRGSTTEYAEFRFPYGWFSHINGGSEVPLERAEAFVHLMEAQND